MSRPTPYAHVGGVPLWARGHHPTKSQGAGAFSADLGPTLSMKLRASPPTGGLSVGLLVCPPKPEGIDYRELEAIGYCRQPVQLDMGAAAYTRGNRSPIVFGPVCEWPEVTHIAIFGEGNEVLYYGRLQPQRAGLRPKEHVEIRPHALRVKLPHTIPNW